VFNRISQAKQQKFIAPTQGLTCLCFQTVFGGGSNFDVETIDAVKNPGGPYFLDNFLRDPYFWTIS
jgi:hypothetical protein